MFCKNCGNELPDGSKFCSKCGAAVQAESVVKKRKFLSILPADLFGIRWIKTARAKIITGIVT